MDEFLYVSIHWLMQLVFGRWRMVCLEPPESEKETILNVHADLRLLTVYCEEIIMTKVYERWWIPNRVYRMYRLTAETHDETAGRLAEAINDPVHFPLLSWFPVGRRLQKNYMVTAYTDVVIARLKKLL